jgi:hypothetical protein
MHLVVLHGDRIVFCEYGCNECTLERHISRPLVLRDPSISQEKGMLYICFFV